MNLRALSLLAVSAALVSGSLTAARHRTNIPAPSPKRKPSKSPRNASAAAALPTSTTATDAGKSKSAEAAPNTMSTFLHKAAASSKWTPTTTATINRFLIMDSYRKPDCLSGFSVFRRPQTCQGRLKTFNLPFYLIRDFQTTTPSRSNNAR